jgi:hypothetical protein
MTRRLTLLIALVVLLCSAALAQPEQSVLPGSRDNGRDAPPKSLRDQMEKMRIAKEKKDFQERLERGVQALRLSEQLEKKLELTNQINREDAAKLESLEKIVKKIRSELGGRDSDSVADSNEEEPDVENADEPNGSTPLLDAFRSLRSHTASLVNELKKTTRFSISTAAIRSSNAVLKLTRFLRLRN